MTQAKKDGAYYRNFFREIDAMHSLQIVPEQREWALTAPKREVKPAQVVLYLGCNVLKTAHLVQTVVDIFKLLEVDFVAVGGASYCCGIQHYNREDDKAGRAMATNTVKNFQKFNPERVVMWCPSCIYFYDDIMQMKESFPFQHVTEFLVENLDRLPFQQRVEANVAVHYHTGRPQTDEEARCALELLSNVPGVNLLDQGTDARLGRSCSEQSRNQLGPGEWDEIISGSLQRAVESKADIFATLYHGCQRVLCRNERDNPLKVEHYLTVLGRALGIEHEDLFKKYMLMGDADAILADASPCAVASGLGPEEARAVIQKSFVELAS